MTASTPTTTVATLNNAGYDPTNESVCAARPRLKRNGHGLDINAGSRRSVVEGLARYDEPTAVNDDGLYLDVGFTARTIGDCLPTIGAAFHFPFRNPHKP